MECLQGRALVIAIGNLELSGAYADALRKLEDVAAGQICYILNPGDEFVESKTLGLKQQYTLCFASLQHIIAHLERRSGKPVKWENFAVQMNDTCPKLCIPELIRILMDWKGAGRKHKLLLGELLYAQIKQFYLRLWRNGV